MTKHIIPYFKQIKYIELNTPKINTFIEYLLKNGKSNGKEGLSVKTVHDISVIDRVIKKYKEMHNKKLFKNAEGQHSVKTQDIVYFESCDHSITIYENNEYRFEITDSLKNLEEEYYVLGFFRIHTGYLVNLDYVFSIEQNKVIVKCGDEFKDLPVSRGRMKALKSAYQQYIRGVR